jgi:peptidoglycan/xylan/chitin deacetylase (PgdA/CDA1 family)
MPLRIKIKAGFIVLGAAGLGGALAWMAVADAGIGRYPAIILVALEILLVLAALEMVVPQVTVLTRSYWRGKRGSSRVGLSFDDGPGDRTTERILETLKRYDARATFFALGKNIRGNEELLLRMVRERHEIGNHGFTHAKMHLMSLGGIEREIRQTEDLIKEITAARTVLLRPPHGFVSPLVGLAARRRGYKIVAWTLGVWDTDRGATARDIRERTLGHIKDGDILLLHDGPGGDRSRVQNATAEALPGIIEGLRARGLHPVPVGEIMKDSDGEP